MKDLTNQKTKIVEQLQKSISVRFYERRNKNLSSALLYLENASVFEQSELSHLKHSQLAESLRCFHDRLNDVDSICSDEEQDEMLEP